VMASSTSSLSMHAGVNHSTVTSAARLQCSLGSGKGRQSFNARRGRQCGAWFVWRRAEGARPQSLGRAVHGERAMAGEKESDEQAKESGTSAGEGEGDGVLDKNGRAWLRARPRVPALATWPTRSAALQTRKRQGKQAPHVLVIVAKLFSTQTATILV
jgi:hypothetical protein